MDKLSEFNNGVKYLLICVDVFSKNEINEIKEFYR